NGIVTGSRTSAAATSAGRTRRRAPPPPAATSTINAFTATTTNVTPHTPVTVASGRRTRSSTCEIPKLPHVNPPSGRTPRTQSTRVHSDATATAETIGRPGRTRPGTRAPTSVVETADRAVSGPHASAPNRKIQYRVAPKNATPKTNPSRAPRQGLARRAIHNHGASATKATGQASAGGNARESRSPDTALTRSAAGSAGGSDRL